MNAPQPGRRGTRSARRLALDALRRIESDGAYANLVLGPMLASSGLDDLDRRFATELVYGTTRMRRDTLKCGSGRARPLPKPGQSCS